MNSVDTYRLWTVSETLVESFLQTSGVQSDRIALIVVEVAVVKHQIYIGNELLHRFIFFITQFFLDCAKIHRIFDNIKVIRTVQSDRIHRREKRSGAAVLSQSL